MESLQLLTVEQVERLLVVSERTLYRMMADGELPFVRVRGSLRFRLSDITELVESNVRVR